MGNKTLEAKAKEVLKDQEKEIIEFFNAHDLNKVNNTTIYNNDFPLIKKYYPSQNRHKIYLEIFNIPALFKENKGFIFTINKLAIYIFKFKEKYENKNITKKVINEKFEEFLKAILEVKVQKIKEILDDNISEVDLINLKQGIEKLYQYFGFDTVKIYYSKIIGIDIGVGLANSMVGALTAFLSGFSVSSIGIIAAAGFFAGIGISIAIGFVAYFIYDYYIKKPNDKNNILNNAECINKFFKEIKEFKVENLEGKNLLILALNNDANNREISIFSYNLNEISSICPIIGDNAEPSSNSFIYTTYLKATEFFIKKYKDRIQRENCIQKKKNIIKDFEDLKKLSVAQIKYLIEQANTDNTDNTDNTNNTNNTINTNSFVDTLPRPPTINTNSFVDTLPRPPTINTNSFATALPRPPNGQINQIISN